MKKRIFSLLLNIVCIALCIGGIAYGVFSVKNANLTVGGTIGFYAYADVSVECKIENARLSDSSSKEGKTYYLTKDNEISTTKQSINLGKVTPTLDISKIAFAKDSSTKQILPLKFTFTITTDSPFTISADLNIDNVNFNNVKYEWGDAGALQIIRPQEASPVDDDSVVETGAIELTMSIIDETETAEEAINGNIILVVSGAKKETDAGFTINESGYLTQVPAGSGEITLPAYIYTDDTYTKVKQLGYSSTTVATCMENISSYSSIKIANGVSKIGNSAFVDCSSLTSITIPSTVTSIGDSAFSKCINLTSITIPSTVASIAASAFSKCIRLTSITIPSSVTSIADFVFKVCSSITSITIPSSVTSIGSYAFSGCSGLKKVIFSDTKTTWNVEYSSETDTANVTDSERAARLLTENYVFCVWTKNS